MKKNKIVVTGGSGRFGRILKKQNFKNYIFPDKYDFDITNTKSIHNYILKIKPKTIIHLAGFSRPVELHESNPIKSIKLNIIGTSNLVKECKFYNIKIIYLSTSYVYPGTKGNYNENDAVKPWNNYSWSKLGGECAVQMYKNSLIVRMCMTEKPFIHKKAYANVKLNFIFQEDAASLLLKILNKKGVINLGGPSQTIYNFARKYNRKIKKIYSKGEFPKKGHMNLKKLKNFIQKK